MRMVHFFIYLIFNTFFLMAEEQPLFFEKDDKKNDAIEGLIPEGIYNDKSQILTIQLTSSNGYFVFITDSAGDIVLREPLKTDGSRNSISLTSLDNGLYFVFLESTTNRFIGKIFID